MIFLFDEANFTRCFSARLSQKSVFHDSSSSKERLFITQYDNFVKDTDNKNTFRILKVFSPKNGIIRLF